MNFQYEELKKLIFAGLDEATAANVEAMAQQMTLAIGLVARLRGPRGCPWDREQDHLTLRPYLIEEAYEVLEVLDRYERKTDPKELARGTSADQTVPANGAFNPTDQKLLREELGDLLLQVILHAQLAAERGEFTAGDVAEFMAAKLVSRHPHVFGEKHDQASPEARREYKVSGSDDVLRNWESLKKKEGKKSLFEGLPKTLPSLTRAARIGEKTGRMGFDWKDWQGSMKKVHEELGELEEAVASGKKPEIEHEMGDLFFALCNLSRHLKINPEDVHRAALRRFEMRFERLEEICREERVDLHAASLEKLDEIWERVKKEQS